MSIILYTKQFKGLLPKVTESVSVFRPAFGNFQVVDGISENDTFMEMKVNNTPVTIQDYSTDPNTAFGTGTGSSNRFGPRTEIIYENTAVKYEAPLAIHEGIDRFTVNANEATAVAERLALHAEAWADVHNARFSQALSENASETLSTDLSEDSIKKLFNDASTAFVNNKIRRNATRRAYVTSDLYNAIVDHKLATTAKNSGANIDKQSLAEFKGFILEVVPDEYFQEGEVAYFTIDGVGNAGIGLEVARTIESEDFNGRALQAAAKYARFIPEENQKAIIKATLTETLSE